MTRRQPGIRERDLQVSAVARLRQEQLAGNLMFCHVPNEGKRSRKKGFKMKREGMVAGAPDLIVWLAGGRSVCIELKTDRGDLSEAQRNFAGGVISLGHECVAIKAADAASMMRLLEGALGLKALHNRFDGFPVALVAKP